MNDEKLDKRNNGRNIILFDFYFGKLPLLICSDTPNESLEINQCV